MPYVVSIGTTDFNKNKKIEVTTNLDRMLKLALGFPLEELNGQRGHLAYPVLAKAVGRMFDPALEPEFDKLLPENNYGTHDQAKEFLLTLFVRVSDRWEQLIVVDIVEKVKTQQQQQISHHHQSYGGGS